MPRTPAEIVADTEAMGREHGEDGMHRIAERVGIDLTDHSLPLAAQQQVQKWALRLDIPEDFARRDMGAVLTSIGAIYIYAFLAGAWWQEQRDEEEPDGIDAS